MATITVKGTGKNRQAADQIELGLDFKTVALVYGEALQQATQKIEAVQECLQGIGFQKNDIKTLNFDVSSTYESYQTEQGNWQQRFVGYQVSQGVKLVFAFSPERLGEVIAAVADSKSQPELTIAFTIADETAFKEDLLQAAVKEAKKNAVILATAASCQLGAIQAIHYDWTDVHFHSETNFAPRLMEVSAAKSAIPDITPADVKGQETVTCIWELVEK